jgi:Tfp pilus assembly protein PilZ
MVTMKLLMPVPDQDETVTVGARVVHVNRTGPRQAPWSEPGLGLQFIDGDDDFRVSIDRFLRQIVYRSTRTG